MNFKHLERPLPIAEQVWPSGTKPLISICCITYNHERYITKAIEGFLLQETTFPVEILIHDDASADATASIIQDYVDKSPSLFTAILQNENQYSLGNKPFPALTLLAKGEFIAVCEGDDFWTHAGKLQRQYELLLEYPEAVMAAHDVEAVYEQNVSADESDQPNQDSIPGLEYFSGEQIIAGKHISPVSTVFRNVKIYNWGKRWRWLVNEDRYFNSMLATRGGVIVEHKKMAAHIYHDGGVWSSADERTRRRNMIEVRVAVILEIEPAFCPIACLSLSKTSWIDIWNILRTEKGVDSMVCMRAYFMGLFCCFRTIQAGIHHIPRVLWTQILILVFPFKVVGVFLARGLMRKLGIKGECDQRASV